MKTSHWTIFLSIITMVLFAVFCIHVSLMGMQTDEDLGAQAILLDASKSALLKSNLDQTNIFAEKSARDASIEEFKECYNIGYDKAGYKENDMNYYVPCIFLVDDNGYYINYSKLVDNNGISETVNTTTDINTWTENYGNYIVRFHLSNIVEVTKADGTTFNGAYSKVYDKLDSPADLSFMADKKSFEEERNDVVCYITENALNYYITSHNQMNTDERNYIFTMPRIDTFEARLMDGPCVISFVQGLQKSTGKGYINAYAFTGAIKEDVIRYYEVKVGNDKFYHTKDCPNITLDDSNSVGKTMDDCAKEGYYPCPDCIK